MNFWGKENNTGIWNEISQQTTICIEKQDKEQFTYEIKNYYRVIRENGKATFLAVARGKISEGLDFSDKYGRAVMMVGIPFAPRNDPKVDQKMRYLNVERAQRPGLPSGDDWYIQTGMRTTNQAMGRVIRHKHDYGAMFFCDARFKNTDNYELISPWIRARLNNQQSFDFNHIVQKLSLFYANAEQEVLWSVANVLLSLFQFFFFRISQLPMHDPEINPESFVLHEDDEWFLTLQTPELPDDRATNDEAVDATINESADISVRKYSKSSVDCVVK